MDLAKREAYVKTMLTCGICKKLIKNVAIIQECCHRFCQKCITKKLTEEKLHHCPVCNVDLGCSPLQNIRQDNHWKEIRDVIRNKRREEIERGLLQQQVKRETEAAATAAAVQVAETSRKEERTLSSLADAAVALAATEAVAAAPKRNVRRGGRRKGSARNAPAAGEPGVAVVEAHPESVAVDGGDGGKQGEASNNQMPKDPFEAMNELRKTLISPEDNAGGEKDCWKMQDGADISGSSKGKEIVVIDDDDDDDNNTNGMDEGSNVVSQQGVKPPSAANNPVTNPRVWFRLIPSEKQSCESRLPEMPDCYILVREVHKSVSYIRKYIAQKLNLQGHHEVEISMLGQAVIGDDITLLQLLGLWCKAMPKVETRVRVGSSAKDFLMTLNYARNIN